MDPPYPDLTQYVILRSDLETDGKSWPRGALIAQACHACVCVNSIFKGDPGVARYTSPENLPHLRTVVLAVEGESKLREYHEALTGSLVGSHLFTEQPENVVTCLATVPVERARVGSLLRKLKTFK